MDVDVTSAAEIVDAAMSEAAWQQLVVDYARMRGHTVVHFHDSRRQAGGQLVGDVDAKGWPDLIVMDPRRRLTWAWEAKRQRRSRVTPEQDEMLGRLAHCGVPARVIRPADWPYVQAVLDRRERP